MGKGQLMLQLLHPSTVIREMRVPAEKVRVTKYQNMDLCEGEESRRCTFLSCKIRFLSQSLNKYGGVAAKKVHMKKARLKKIPRC